MSSSDPTRELALVGMDANQAAAYVRLSIRGPLRAAELAADLGVTRQEAYRLLHAMMARGFVLSDLGHPATFRASPPGDVFARALASQTAKVKELRHADAAVTEAMRGIRSAADAPAPPTFRIVRGREENLAAAASLIAGARASLRLLSMHPAAMSLAESADIKESVLEQARQGVDVRAIVRADLVEAGVDETLLEAGILRAIDADVSGGVLIADDRAALLSLVSDPSVRLRAGEDVALWTDAPDLARLQATLFDALWEAARPASRLRAPARL